MRIGPVLIIFSIVCSLLLPVAGSATTGNAATKSPADVKNTADAAHGDHAVSHSKSGSKPHVHPAAEPEGNGASLDERLGTRIPLDLTFRDATGKQVRLGDLIDRPTLIAPVYYKCSNVCSFLQGGLAEILPDVNLRPGEDYLVLSISFDETEQPALAASSKQMYLQAAGGAIPPDAWRFLTGERENIVALLDSVGYHFQRKGVDFLHPVAAFVVSPEGVVTRYLHGTRFLPKDVTLALVEASEGRVGTTIQKMLRYCFSYDPEGKTYVFNLLRVTGAVVLLTAGGFLLFLFLGGKKKSSRKQP